MNLKVRMTLEVQNSNGIVFVTLKLVGIDPLFVFLPLLVPENFINFKMASAAILKNAP